MTRLALATLLLAPLALAAPKKATAIGSAKEDAPCPELPSTAGPDVAFQRAVLWAFEPAPPEVRAQAIEDLGLLGDARALNPLAALCLDANPAIARAAVRAVGTIRHPRAEEILSNLVRHPTAPVATKQLSLSLLPWQNTPTALRFIHFTSRQPSGAYELLAQARALAAALPFPTAEAAMPQEPAAPPPAAMTPTPFPGNAQ